MRAMLVAAACAILAAGNAAMSAEAPQPLTDEQVAAIAAKAPACPGCPTSTSRRG